MTVRSFKISIRQFLVIGLLLTGCADSDLAPASGVVKIGGANASVGRVVFRPMDGGKTSVGNIESDGSFVMKVENRYHGAQIGENQVLVIDAAISADEDAESYRSPPKRRLSVVPDKDNQFLIDVDELSGWSTIE